MPLAAGVLIFLSNYISNLLIELERYGLFMTVPQIDYLIVHWFVFAFDLTVAMWMMWSRTRHVAMLFCALFHLMNSRLFSIGMFPWVCLATMPLFYPFDWPKITTKYVKDRFSKLMNSILCVQYNTKITACTTPENEKMNNVINNEITKSVDVTKKIESECFVGSSEDAGKNYNKMDIIQNLENDSHDVKKINNGNHDNTKTDSLTKEAEEICNETIIDRTLANNKHDVDKLSSENAGKSKIDYFINHNGKENSKVTSDHVKTLENYKYDSEEQTTDYLEKRKKIWTTLIILLYMILQAFLPYSHFITKGYNNWTNGLYGYSWDMMVHAWDINSVVVKVVDNTNNEEFFVDPHFNTLNDRWSRHGDMLCQYASCLNDRIIEQSIKNRLANYPSTNISIYVDIWYSMNGRFTQRMFDPKVDLLKVSWSPFEPISYLMPLLDEALHWRSTLSLVKEEMLSLNNNSEVIFIADFPGYDQEKYIPNDLINVSVTVLEGVIALEPEVSTNYLGQSYLLYKGDHQKLNSESAHKIINIKTEPVFYMYSFIKYSEANSVKVPVLKPKSSTNDEFIRRLIDTFEFLNIVFANILQIFFQQNCPHH